MRLPSSTTRALSRMLSAGAGRRASPKPLLGPSLRHALLISGVGLSVLALANAELAGDTCAVADAHCDARYAPPEADASAFTVPLDGELFLPVANSRATRVSCATYKANFPIEDKFDVQISENGDVFAAVLDGHGTFQVVYKAIDDDEGGWQVSEYARKSLISNVQKELAALHKGDGSSGSASSVGDGKTPLTSKKVAGAIQRGFGRTDRELMEDVASAFKLGFGAVARCGSCALLVYVDGGAVHVANAGDIRAVLGRLDTDQSKPGDEASSKTDVVAVAMSHDHNAMSIAEQEKLRKEHPGEANVFTCRHPESCYVKSALQPTRALGDFSLKYSEFNGPPYLNGDRSAGRHFAAPYTPPYISAIPEVKQHTLDSADQFIIVGSDGVWDFLSNQEAVDIVREQALAGNHASAGRALVERVLQKSAKRYEMSYQDLLSLPAGSHRRRRHDDTTAVVVFFD